MKHKSEDYKLNAIDYNYKSFLSKTVTSKIIDVLYILSIFLLKDHLFAKQ